MASDIAACFSPAIIKHAKVAYEQQSASAGGISSFDDFLKTPASPEGDVLSPLDVDTSFPISNYFVSSSHNTYLTGNQLYSKASTEAYKDVLCRGCRCIEIDVWDGDEVDAAEAEAHGEGKGSELKQLTSRFKKGLGRLRGKREDDEEEEEANTSTQAPAPPDEEEPTTIKPWRVASNRAEPRVLHGHTATREVSFRKVCETVGQYAFSASDMPLIVSLEIHTCPAQQEIMVEIMQELWKDFLVIPPAVMDDSTPLPTLDSLRKRILIKVKFSPPSSGKSENVKPADNPEAHGAVGDSSEDEDQLEHVKKGSIIAELGRLGVYTRSCHFKDFDQPESKLPTHVFALSEKKIIQSIEKHASRLFDHNKIYLMRVYPKGLRVTSSNLDPAPFWRHGVQMVALNWQNINAAMMLNEAMFAGTAGWVLKPQGYHQGYDPVMSQVDVKLNIEIMAGQHIGPAGKKPKVYVRCELHVDNGGEETQSSVADGGKVKEGEVKLHTATVHGGRDPDFEQEVLAFETVHGVVPSLSFVR